MAKAARCVPNGWTPASKKELSTLHRLFRAILNRYRVKKLLEKEAHELCDIGLSPSDLRRALMLPLHKDPSAALATVAGQTAESLNPCRSRARR
ncbi:hypothetical protein SAZ10_12230 [Mesorhizobium sp. BAC0120]|uniref:hypothetical protein n=1 Tax=Mesorhizobium sp. BAC0120 TaxID=3090670 RepID=UPI00298C617C|nr:hypothetical protein [Mesorhizobium sp. BAC0120]MDW6022521.1 hypothetical protein [Mesorhizobium sp. BAC0120]